MNDPYFDFLLAELTAPEPVYGRAGPIPAGVLDLGVGEVRYRPPAHLRAEIGAAAAGIEGMWYSELAGETPLRAAYLDHLGLGGEDPDRVLVTAGGKEAAFLALRYLMRRRAAAAVLVPWPGWEPYPLWARAAGVQVFGYDPLEVAANPSVLRERLRACDPRPVVLVVNYPNNPTGACVSREVMDEIIGIAVEFDLEVLSDEVYRVFGEPPVSAVHAPGFDPRHHLVVDSVSKSATVAGLRVGFLHAEPEVVADLAAYRGAYASCTSVLTQRVATELLISAAARAWLAGVTESVTETRAATADALTAHGIEVTSHGALYVWCRVPTDKTMPREPVAGGARLRGGAAMGATDHVRVCTAREDLDPHFAAAAVARTLRGR
ncbi:pyridoxal phosphate-dependent aminotransferase [Nocardia takedensis]|uniref:pyridoxal phosphate-dependent aminotransferase n=1 Tax=Nocardia takedensis TaxID=259390 RepID=UPI0002F60707|nr:pyridoxal phosphate-dependent aminotransferase [Nocardia takedensis]